MRIVRILVAVSVVLCLSAVAGAQEKLAAFDTGAASADAIAAERLGKAEGWTRLSAAGDAKGDLVLVSEKIAVVLRKGAAGLEVYGKSGEQVKARGQAIPLGLGAAKLEAAKLTELTRAGATAEATFKDASGKQAVIRVSVSRASPMIAKTEPVSGATGLRLANPTRLGLLPDFFADDMLIDARTIPVDNTEIPSENFFVELLDGGNAMLAAIWDKNTDDVKISLSGQDAGRMIVGVDMKYGDKGSIWLATLESQGIWATVDVTAANVKSVIPLADWTVPFAAKWKGDFIRTDHTVDSWEFANIPDGNRRRWSSTIASLYEWPCWFDKAGKGYIQAATKFPNGNFDGPFVVYPIDRTSDTPTDQFSVTDLMRQSMGQGPCEYITDQAGQGATDKGLFTCAVDAEIPAIFASGRAKEERVLIDRILTETQVFVKAIADRIGAYVEFRGEMLKYLGQAKTQHPDLAPFIAKLEEQTKKIQATKVDNNATVAGLVAQIKAEAMSDTPREDMYNLTAENGRGIATFGGRQDDIVARCRNATKILRQMATIEMAVNPKSAPVAKEVRARTQKALRGALGHEMH